VSKPPEENAAEGLDLGPSDGSVRNPEQPRSQKLLWPGASSRPGRRGIKTGDIEPPLWNAWLTPEGWDAEPDLRVLYSVRHLLNIIRIVVKVEKQLDEAHSFVEEDKFYALYPALRKEVFE
jgi:hypothetical protein